MSGLNGSVDLVIPAWNAHATIDRALASAAMQTEKPTVVIADDASAKGYADVAARWRGVLDVRLVRLEENGGPGLARQAGLETGSGEFVAFMDADDALWGATALEQLADELRRGADAAVGGFYEQLPDGRLLPHGPNMTWMFAKMYRRDFLERFDIRFNDTRANEDAGFNGLVKACTRAIAFIPEPLYLWHFKPDSITRADGWAYTSRAGYDGFVENMIRLAGEIEKRGLGAPVSLGAAAEGMCAIYFAYLEALRNEPSAGMALIRRAADYYARVYARAETYIGRDRLTEAYLSAARSNAALLGEIVPEKSLFQFIEELKKEAANG